MLESSLMDYDLIYWFTYDLTPEISSSLPLTVNFECTFMSLGFNRSAYLTLIPVLTLQAVPPLLHRWQLCAGPMVREITTARMTPTVTHV